MSVLLEPGASLMTTDQLLALGEDVEILSPTNNQRFPGKTRWRVFE